VKVAGLNLQPSSPGRASSQELAQANGKLTSQGGQSGGASQQPTDSQAQSYNVGTPNSPGAPIIQTSSQGRANALTAANAMGQTVQQGAQNSASTGTGTRVAIQNLIQALTPVKPPPITPPPIVPPPIIPPPIIPPVVPAPTATYAMVTHGPFSTTTGASPVPYLTGAFAGTGNFTVSPILGYQKGGLNTDGTPNTSSRQFQAGLSVTGQGATQNATLFVMTSAINNAPNIGFTQAGGFMGVTMRNPAGSAGWYGVANGAVSSAATSAPNTVPTQNGVPIAGFSLHNSSTNLNTGTVSNTRSYNYVQTGPANYNFNPVTVGSPTTLGNNHPTLSLNGYVGGVMVTATGGASPPFTNYTKPYVITNLTGQPGDVGIFLPGNSSEMLASFNVGSVNAPNNAMTSSNYLFGSLNGNGQTVLNGARGTYVNPSNFGARDAAVFANGANIPLSSRNGQPLASVGGYANQQLVTAESVGANTSAFLTSISTSGTPVKPCACDSTQWGFWSAINGANNNGQLAFEDQGILLLWVGGVPTTAGALSQATGTAAYTGHAIASIATGVGAQTYLAAGAFSNLVNFGARSGTVTITGLDGTNYKGTAGFTFAPTSPAGTAPTFATLPNAPLLGNVGGRTAALDGSFFQGGPTNVTPLYGEMGGSLVLSNLAGNPNYLGSGIFAARR
jgi:hypothetical protein